MQHVNALGSLVRHPDKFQEAGRRLLGLRGLLWLGQGDDRGLLWLGQGDGRGLRGLRGLRGGLLHHVATEFLATVRTLNPKPLNPKP